MEITNFGSYYSPVSSAAEIPENGLLECLNMVPNGSGGLRSRAGLEQISTSSGSAATAAFIPICAFYTNALGARLLLSDGTNAVTLDRGGTLQSAAADGTGTLNGGGDVADDGKYYMPMSTNAIKSVTNASVVVDTTGLAAFITYPMKYHQGRLFSCGQDDRSKIYYTDVNTYTVWPSLNYIQIGGGNVSITDLFSLGDRLIIFTNSEVWVLYTSSTPANWVTRKVIQGVGTDVSTAYRAFSLDGKRIYFTNSRGLWATDGVNFKNVSDPFLPTNVFGDGSYRACPFSNNEILLTYTDGGVGTSYLYNTDLNSFSRFSVATGNIVTGWTSVIMPASDGNGLMVYIGDAVGTSHFGTKKLARPSVTVYTDTLTSGLQNITKTVRTKYSSFGKRFEYKRILQLLVEVEGVSGTTPSFTPGYYADSASVTTRPVETAPTTGLPLMARYAGPEMFRNLSFYYNSTDSNGLELLAFGAELKESRTADD